MCSIIAYAGLCSDTASILVDALSLMEYRGYDSVGIAVLEGSRISVRKGVGNVREVNKAYRLEELKGSIGIGHTRWATHGSVSYANAHPHLSCNDGIALVHNGIIDNHPELREMLKGHVFKSETDSEVIVHLLEHLLEGKDLRHAIATLIRLLKGSYAFVAMLNNGVLIGSRHNEPLIIGIGSNSITGRRDDKHITCNSCFIASDVLAFIKYTDRAVFLSNDEFFILKPSKNGYVLSIYNARGKRISKQITQIAWEFSIDAIDKGKYAHYTLKEIHEQEHAIVRALCLKVSQDFIDILLNARRVIVTGSGSSYHASLYAKHLLARTGINVDAIVASELKYSVSISRHDVILAVSQSGETADLLDAVRYAKGIGCMVLALVNVTTSSLARESDLFISINAGPEIGVAATKSFTAQLASIYRIARMIADGDSDDNASIVSKGVRDILADTLPSIADSINTNDIYIIGKGINHVIALEGALKLKELAYIHAEAINAGELKHGPLTLIDDKSIVIALNAKDDTYNDVINSIREVKARGAYVIGISDHYCKEYDIHIRIPSVDCRDTISMLAYPVYQCVPLQLLAYNIAVKRNYNPDYPRNIAKSVTVT